MSMDKETEDAIIARALCAPGAIEEKLRAAIRMTADRPRSFRVQYRTGDTGGGSLNVLAASAREAIDLAALEVMKGRGGQFDAEAWEITEGAKAA
jgi:hypothetical protein